jgi:alkylation response protein AidB-like acyl-CoA dehydrogenase
MGLAGVELTDCFVANEALFARPGEGFKLAMSGIDVARTLVSAMCCGMIEASLAFALKATAERSAIGSKTIDFQGVQWPTSRPNFQPRSCSSPRLHRNLTEGSGLQ